jgi:hypothetical protein
VSGKYGDTIRIYRERQQQLNLDEFMKELDGAWPTAMPPEQLEVVVATEDQVTLDIKGMTLQFINDKETVVIEFEPVDFSEVTVPQLDQMIAFLEKKKVEKSGPESDADKALHEQLREDSESDADSDEGTDSRSDAGRVVANSTEEDEGNDDAAEASDTSVVASS